MNSERFDMVLNTDEVGQFGVVRALLLAAVRLGIIVIVVLRSLLIIVKRHALAYSRQLCAC